MRSAGRLSVPSRVRGLSVASRSVPIAAHSLVGVATLRCGCGMRAAGCISVPSRGIRLMSVASRSVPIAAHSLVGVATLRCGCGMRSAGCISVPSRGIRGLSVASRSVPMGVQSLVGVGMAQCSCGNSYSISEIILGGENVVGYQAMKR